MDSTKRSVKKQVVPHRICKLLFFAAVEILLLSLAIPTVLNLWRTGSIPTRGNRTLLPDESGQRSCDCGANIAEALILGCKYDSMAAAWLPEHCRDDDLTAEFERSGTGPNGTWQYWSDTKHSQLMSLEEVAALADQPGGRFHMDNQWHVIHCIFYWMKEHRARFNGKMVEPRSDNEQHIKHCGHIFTHGAYGSIAGVPLNTDGREE